MKFKKELSFIVGILIVFGMLVFIETRLPNFARFFPVWENKLLIVVLNINLLLILLLLFLITRIILKAYIEKRRGIWGSGLKKRLNIDAPFHIHRSVIYPFHTGDRFFLCEHGPLVQSADRGYAGERP